jgi:hypothetical protein
MEIDVRSTSGNVFAIMGVVTQLLEAAGRKDEVARVMADMRSGDYRHALEVAERETFGSLTFVGSDGEGFCLRLWHG